MQHQRGQELELGGHCARQWKKMFLMQLQELEVGGHCSRKWKQMFLSVASAHTRGELLDWPAYIPNRQLCTGKIGLEKMKKGKHKKHHALGDPLLSFSLLFNFSPGAAGFPRGIAGNRKNKQTARDIPIFLNYFPGGCGEFAGNKK